DLVVADDVPCRRPRRGRAGVGRPVRALRPPDRRTVVAAAVHRASPGDAGDHAPGGKGPAGEEGDAVSSPAARAPQHTLVDARAALREVVPEFVRLVRSIPDPNAAAVGTWRVGDVAAHVSHVCGADTDALAGRTLPAVTVSTASVAELTAAMLADDSERDPAVLADRIGALADAFDEVAARCEAHTVTWLGG